MDQSRKLNSLLNTTITTFYCEVLPTLFQNEMLKYIYPNTLSYHIPLVCALCISYLYPWYKYTQSGMVWSSYINTSTAKKYRDPRVSSLPTPLSLYIFCVSVLHTPVRSWCHSFALLGFWQSETFMDFCLFYQYIYSNKTS